MTEVQTDRLSVEEHAASMADYLAAGKERALALGNRGPLRLTDDGNLHPDILAAYQAHGFYVFEGLIEESELGELGTRGQWDRVVQGLDKLLAEGGDRLIEVQPKPPAYRSVRDEARRRLLG